MTEAPRIIHGECVATLASLEPESVHAVICDPPYELGFMGKSWDSAGVSYRPETWAACLRVLKPGGYLLAFGGTRTYHRIAVAIEDAGFEIRDSLHWIYASGFPKSLDASKAIDANLGGERVVVGQRDGTARPGFSGPNYGDGVAAPAQTFDVTESATAEAKRWEGWGTALKPAHEPVVMARKPLAGTVAANLLTNGVGALNVAGCRIGTDGGTAVVAGSRGGATGSTDFPCGAEKVALDAGRFPSNVLLGHLPDCQGSGPLHTDTLCVAGCPVAELNGMSGETAARFFYVSKPRTRERIGGTIRNLHPTVKPIDLMRYLVRLVTPPGGIVCDPFLGSGTTGCACVLEGAGFIGIEQDRDSYETSLSRISDYAFAAGLPRPALEATLPL